MKLKTIVALPILLATAYAVTRAWLILFGRKFYGALVFRDFVDSKMPNGTGLRTGFASFFPPYAIYAAAAVSVGLAFFALSRKRRRPWVSSALFFLIVFIVFQTLSGYLWSYYVGSFYDHHIFDHSTTEVASGPRILFTLERLPTLALASMTIGVCLTFGLCPAVALATALVSFLFYPRRPLSDPSEAVKLHEA